MINLGSLPPSPPSNSELHAVAGLVEIVKDPAAAKKRIAGMVAAQVAWQQATADCHAAIKELEAKRVDTEAAIAKAEAKHFAKLAAEQAAHDRKCAAT